MFAFSRAFWLFGPTSDHYYAYDSIPGEIDFFEYHFYPDGNEYPPSKWGKKHQFTIHTGHYGEGEVHKSETYFIETDDLTNDFHKYTCEWTPHVIRYYIDGVLKQQIANFVDISAIPIYNCSQLSAGHYYAINNNYPTNPMGLVFNFALESGINASPDNYLPDSYQIKSIKVWQRMSDFSIDGASSVNFGNTTPVTFEVPYVEGASYTWNLPALAGRDKAIQIQLQQLQMELTEVIFQLH